MGEVITRRVLACWTCHAISGPLLCVDDGVSACRT